MTMNAINQIIRELEILKEQRVGMTDPQDVEYRHAMEEAIAVVRAKTDRFR
jgi:hypothetical protein